MKKALVASMMLVTGVVTAQTPPVGWVNVPTTSVYIDTTATVHSHNGYNTRAVVWGWTVEQGYMQITVGCAFANYSIVKDDKIIIDTRPYNPGHQFWFIKKAFC